MAQKYPHHRHIQERQMLSKMLKLVEKKHNAFEQVCRGSIILQKAKWMDTFLKILIEKKKRSTQRNTAGH